MDAYATMRPVWHFPSTGDAYDGSNCFDELTTGDVLLIPSEKVVGIVDAWPVAVTELNGALHSVKSWEHYRDDPDFKNSLWSAVELARALGYPLTPALAKEYA